MDVKPFSLSILCLCFSPMQARLHSAISPSNVSSAEASGWRRDRRGRITSRERSPGKATSGLRVMPSRARPCAAWRLPLRVPLCARCVRTLLAPCCTIRPRISCCDANAFNILANNSRVLSLSTFLFIE
uniref:Secreted protein n=1 Tax=Cacopsylla melanoneura TaxID=428564 RepID=A0A8D8ZU14_9HEMI